MNTPLKAGVRNFEREIGRVLRKIARLKTEKKEYPKRITPAAITKFLGPQQFFETEAEGDDEVGVATALAWTENGGEIMPVEVLIMDGKGNLQITGQIGEVMQESAQAALSYIKSRSDVLEIDPDIFENIGRASPRAGRCHSQGWPQRGDHDLDCDDLRLSPNGPAIIMWL